MIQFNLLPDVKLEYIKAERTKRLVLSIAVLASIVALVVFLILLFTVDIVQKKNMDDLTKDIGKYGKQLKGTPSLSKILTVQSQLDSLTQLHDDKPAASRTFAFMNQLTPTQAKVSKLDVDYVAHTIVITGKADTLDTVNQYVDVLKFTNFKTDEKDSKSQPAFSAVVLSTFGRDISGANFSITMGFDQTIFDTAHNVTLSVDTSKAKAVTAAALLQKGNN